MIRILPFLLLAACASPSPEFLGAREQQVTRDGRGFPVFQRGNRAQVIRLGYANRRERAVLPDTMVAVMEEVTRCRVIPASIRGDSGEMRARLRCP